MTGLCARQRREIRCRSRSTAKRPCEEEDFLASWGLCIVCLGFFDLVGVSGSKRPHEKEAFPISWGCPARSGPTRRKLFWSRGGLCGEPGPRQCRSSNSGFCTDTAANGEVMEPPEKEALKIRGVEKSKCQSDSPPKKKFLKIRGAGKSKCQSDSPPKKKFLKIRGVVKSKFQARQPPENKKSSISGGLPGWQSGKSPPRERSF